MRNEKLRCKKGIFIGGILIMMSLFIGSVSAVQFPSKGLIFHAPFDEHINAVQSGGVKEPLKSFNHAPQFYEGVRGKAVLCGVGNEGLVYSSKSNLLPEKGSVALWVALTGDAPLKGRFRTFFKCRTGTNASYLMMYQHVSYSLVGLLVFPEEETKLHQFISKIDWRPGEFRHLCMTWENKKVRCYVDGVLVGEKELPYKISTFDKTFQIGGKTMAPSPEKSDMLFDDLRIYNRPLSPIEVKMLAARNAKKKTSGKMASLKIDPAQISIPYLQKVSEKNLRESGAMITGFIDVGGLPYGKCSRNQTKVWSAWNEKGLYLLYETGFLGEKLKKVSERNDQYSGSEDAIEIFLHPDRSKKKVYYQFNLTAGGFQYDALVFDKSFKSSWIAKTRTEDKNWISYMFIPFADIKLAALPGTDLGLRLCRDWAGAQRSSTSWSITAADSGWHNPEGFATAKLVKNGLIAQIKSVGELWKGEACLKATIINMSKENRKVNISYGIYENSGAGLFSASDDFVVNAGSKHDIQLEIPKAITSLSENGYYIARYDIETKKGEKLASAVLPFVFNPKGKKEKIIVVRKLTEKELDVARKQAKNSWLKEKVGGDHSVPSPFTPGRSSGNKIEVYGRCYQFSKNGLLSQLKNQDKDMLVKPVNLVSIKDSKRISWDWQWDSIKHPYEDRHTITGYGTGPGLKAQVDVTVEFDGFARYDLTISPVKPGADVSPLDLEIVIPAELAAFQSGIGKWYRPSFISSHMKSSFVPVLWMGNEDIGLSWSAESQAGWIVNDFENALEIKRDKKNTHVFIHLFDSDSKIKDEHKISFALQGTPMRPMRKNWRYYSFYSTAPNKKARKDGWVYLREERWWNNGFFSIKPYTVDNWFTKRIKKAEKMYMHNIRKGESNDMRILTYSCPLTMNCDAYGKELPEWALFGKDWMVKPSKYTVAVNIEVLDGKVGYDRSQAAYLCPRSSFSDYRPWELQEFLKLAKKKYPRVKGMYWDLSDINLCENSRHGCGYEIDGIRIASWPTFAMREYVKRMYKVGRRFDPDFMQIYHAFNLGSPASSFIDGSLLGEQYRSDVKKSYFDVVTPEETRAMFIGRQFGWSPYFLPELGHDKAKGPTEEMCAMFLPLDAQICSIFCNTRVVEKYKKILYAFGMKDNVRFVGYWKKNTALRPDNKNIWVSAYMRPGKALLLITNPLKEDVTTTFKLDRKILGFAPRIKLKAKDAVADKPIEIKGDIFTLDLKARRLRMIQIIR